jgi:hypothetical protein
MEIPRFYLLNSEHLKCALSQPAEVWKRKYVLASEIFCQVIWVQLDSIVSRSFCMVMPRALTCFYLLYGILGSDAIVLKNIG